MKKIKCKICKQETDCMLDRMCKDCYNEKSFKNENYSKLMNYLKKKFNNFSVHGNILRQIKELRQQDLTDKQILYIIYYTFDVLKKFNIKYNYTIALCMTNGGDALEHAKKKNIDLLTIKKDYFQMRLNENKQQREEQRKEREEDKINNEIIKIKEQLEYELKEKQRLEETEKQRIIWENTPITKISEFQLEEYLINNLYLIEKGLIFIKNQYSIERGVIDILAKDKNNNDCIIELKVDNDDKRIIYQCAYYPTQINNGNCRMITVAPDYSTRIKSALQNLKYVEMFKYNIVFGTNKNPIKKLVVNKFINK